MSRRLSALCLTVAAATCGAHLQAAEGPSIGKDLKATIALQGHTCDQIASSKRNADSDYAVTCKDGSRYHVFVNAQGRVVVEKQ
jgi:hypothetical protein